MEVWLMIKLLFFILFFFISNERWSPSSNSCSKGFFPCKHNLAAEKSCLCCSDFQRHAGFLFPPSLEVTPLPPTHPARFVTIGGSSFATSYCPSVTFQMCPPPPFPAPSKPTNKINFSLTSQRPAAVCILAGLGCSWSPEPILRGHRSKVSGVDFKKIQWQRHWNRCWSKRE